MSRPWNLTAIALFGGALVFGGLAGEDLLAVSRESQSDLRLYTEILQTAHDQFGDDVAYRELVYASIQGMLRTLDPHTNFLSPESYEEMRERQAGSFFGLGILVSMRDGQLTVISPIEGTPAWRLGLRAGDVISTIEGQPTDTMTLDEAVDKLKGPKDTDVHITIARRGLEDQLQLTITRAEIPQSTVRYAYLMRPDVGYVRLTDFSRSTAGEMRDAIAKLQKQGMRRLILDLRSNGGGLLDQTIAVSNLFVPPDSRIVETRGRTRDSRQVFFAEDEKQPLDLPVVVLVNNGTASAAEILAGAIQDHDVGLVLGTPTWGKGLVQTVYNLSYGAGIALTTAKYYTPSGRLIQRDYSDYWAYYTHFNNPNAVTDIEIAPEVSIEGSPFATDTGRRVFGGGGIAPDIEVDLPETPPGVPLLYTRNAFFEFAVDYHSRHPVTDPAWQPPESILDDFRAWLAAEEIGTAEELEEIFSNTESRDIARRQIHADIANSAFGTEAAHRVLAEGDVQIRAALEAFDRAAALLAQRQTLGDEAPRVQVPRTAGSEG